MQRDRFRSSESALLAGDVNQLLYRQREPVASGPLLKSQRRLLCGVLLPIGGGRSYLRLLVPSSFIERFRI